MNFHPHDPRLNGWYRHVQGRPGWVWTTTVAVAATVVVLPLLLLTLAALLVAAAVFVVLSLIVAGLRLINRSFGAGASSRRSPAALDRDDGRRNVRVIERL